MKGILAKNRAGLVRGRRWTRRLFRKHRVALLLFVVFHVIFLFPSLFLGRVLSPNDIHYGYFPWSSFRQVEPQNPYAFEPAMILYPQVNSLWNDPQNFHWNRFLASGSEGLGSAASGAASPFLLLPFLVFPLALWFTGVILLGSLVAFLFGYLWLREERLGKEGAAVGSAVLAFAGVYSLQWLTSVGTAVFALPALLWLVARAIRRGRVDWLPFGLLIAVPLISGSWSAAVIVILLIALVIVSALPTRERAPVWTLIRLVFAAFLGCLIVYPMLPASPPPAAHEVTESTLYPLEHLRVFLDPLALGNPGRRLWRGDPALGDANHLADSTFYVGWIPLGLSLVGVFRRSARRRRFWFLLVGTTMVLLFAFPAGWLTGAFHRGSADPRLLRLLLPAGFAYLTGAGAALLLRLGKRGSDRAGRMLRGAVLLGGLITVTQLALFAGAYYPYIPRDVARLPDSPTVEFLRAEERPFRIAPTFPYLVPHQAELVGLEDIRTRGRADERYAAILNRIDPSIRDGSAPSLLNSQSADFSDPLMSMMNVRFILEPPPIDIIRWRVYAESEASGELLREAVLPEGGVLTQQVQMPHDEVEAIEFTLIPKTSRGLVRFEVIRPETGAVLLRRTRTARQLELDPKTYLPLRRRVAAHQALLVRIQSRDLVLGLPIARDAGGKTHLMHGFSRSPLVYRETFVDGRIYENLRARERYFAAWDTVDFDWRTMIAQRGIDLARIIAVPDLDPGWAEQIAAISHSSRRVEFRVQEYGSARQRVRTSSRVPFLFVASERTDPSLRVELDGTAVEPLVANGVFTAFPVTAGEHEIVMRRRLGRGRWPASFGALFLLGLAAALEARRSLARRE